MPERDLFLRNLLDPIAHASPQLCRERLPFHSTTICFRPARGSTFSFSSFIVSLVSSLSHETKKYRLAKLVDRWKRHCLSKIETYRRTHTLYSLFTKCTRKNKKLMLQVPTVGTRLRWKTWSHKSCGIFSHQSGICCYEDMVQGILFIWDPLVLSSNESFPRNTTQHEQTNLNSLIHLFIHSYMHAFLLKKGKQGNTV